MASLEELEQRVAAVEAQVRAVREDAAAARVLAGGTDRDVSAFAARLDVLTALLDALRTTPVEQGQRLGGVEQRLAGLEQEMRSGFATLAVGQAEILARLNRLNRLDRTDGS